MKTDMFTYALLLLPILFCLGCRSAVVTQSFLHAGAAQTVITPPTVGTFLIGPMANSTGIHDDLYARVLVLSDSHTKFALITAISHSTPPPNASSSKHYIRIPI